MNAGGHESVGCFFFFFKTNVSRDFVRLKCFGCSHGPLGERRVVSEGGKEGFQLKVRAKGI